MKKNYLLIGSLAFFQFYAKAQSTKDTTVQKIRKTEIELVYNHYIQDGNNSAVTGGIGTEKLTVYGPSVYLKKSSDKNSVSLNLGADIISSASTDNIDYVQSSASKVDMRSYMNVSVGKKFSGSGIAVNAGTGFSIESDYFSIASRLGLSKTDKNDLRTITLDFQIFNDDLRWGRLNPDHRKPVKLIYPSELRNRDWYDENKRNSYNIKLGFIQVLNKRNILGIFPEFTYQEGLLATPFHRVYFADSSLVVENLPDQRFKKGLAIRLNTFSGGNIILKNTVNGYSDNFGILALSIENETAIKLKPFLTLLPGVRFYKQRSAKYFAPYQQHNSGEEYYTSDYDLSAFENYGVGIGLKYKTQKYASTKKRLSTFIFRYYFTHRSNNLNSHALSLVFQSEYYKEKN